MAIQSDASSSDPVSPNDLFPPLNCWLCPSSLALSIIAHFEPYILSNSSKSTQAYLLLLAPLVELFSRTAIPHVLLDIVYLSKSIFIIGLVGQSMLDPPVSISELWKQIILNPITESFQVIRIQGLHIFAPDNGGSQLLGAVTEMVVMLAICELARTRVTHVLFRDRAKVLVSREYMITHVDQKECHCSVPRVWRQLRTNFFDPVEHLRSTPEIWSLSSHHDHERHAEDDRDLRYGTAFATGIWEDTF
jgi:hypothetical protein